MYKFPPCNVVRHGASLVCLAVWDDMYMDATDELQNAVDQEHSVTSRQPRAWVI